MIFNSFEFLIFLPTVFFIYWYALKEKTKTQNFLIVVASYFFYGWWDWRFLGLIFISTILDFIVGIKIFSSKGQANRKRLLFVSLFINLTFLGVFKYFNFFSENLVIAFSELGITISNPTLNILLPVGISFYTFQTLSYSIDIYKSKLEPSKDFIAFAAFVSFFPQLVAGPIERASHLLPQFSKRRIFDYIKFVDGLRQILWGLFKKMVIADNCGYLADTIFNDVSSYNGLTLFFGAVFFAFQIYGDFSGYSDIAIGVSRLFGFDLKKNFAFPYFSRDVAEFWRRWHISLTTWFRDYVYFPLGGSNRGLKITIRNTIIIFLISGFWHGANWTYIFWGGLNALYFIPLLISGKNRNHIHIIGFEKQRIKFTEIVSVIGTFILITLSWVFFRSNSLSDAFIYFQRMISSFGISQFADLIYLRWGIHNLILIVFFVAVEWKGRMGEFAIDQIGQVNSTLLRWSFYTLLLFLIGVFMLEEGTPFIYFQF